MSIEIIPAIDLRGGRVVRLRQGDYARETAYADDPLELARRYRDAGARRLHVVDLDGARAGAFANLPVIEAMAGLGLSIQAGGGVRGEACVQRLLDAGVRRVVVGSLAVRQPERVIPWLAGFGAENLVLALDTRRVEGEWTLPVQGWTEASTARLDGLVQRYANAGARHLLCTDIERDGMLAGPNLDLYAELARLAPGLSVQASGGVRDASDIEALRGRAAAVIVGRSLLEARLALAEAIAC